jgi:hypothetical protein
MSLTYDQIPAERRTILDFTGRLEDQNGTLGVALAQWAARDGNEADASVTRAGNIAIDSIDAMLRELGVLRNRLLDEKHDRTTIIDARAGALLAATP